jgi:hypothetical protein
LPDAPDLIIPVRMDVDGATRGLGKLGPAGMKAGDQVAAGAKRGQAGLQGMAAGADTASAGLLALGRAQIGFGMVRQAGQAIGQEFKRAADYVTKLAEEFSNLRKSMQEVATLKGEANTTEFTLAEAKKAQEFHLTPQEFRDFQAEFQNYAGSQVGTGENGQVAPGAKLTKEQGEQYGGRVAELMKASGISPQIGAELAGSLLEQKNGPQDVESLMKELSRTFTVLEKGRVPLNRALPQLSEIMGHGVGAEEAAKMFSIVSPASPGQEGTAVQAALRAVDEMKAKGTGEEFGVKRGMSQYESVKAFAENINKRKKDLVASGKTQQEAEDEVSALLQEQNVAADVRERRGLVSGFGRQGVELGGFERYERIAEQTPENFETVRRETYEKSEEGQHEKARIDQAVATAERGAKQQDVQLELEQAKARVTRSGELEHGGVGQIIGGAVGTFTGVSSEQQMIDEEAIRNLRQRAGVAEPGTAAADVGLLSQESVNTEIRDLLKIIAENSKKEEDKKPAAERQAGPPLASRPAGGAGARQ